MKRLRSVGHEVEWDSAVSVVLLFIAFHCSLKFFLLNRFYIAHEQLLFNEAYDLESNSPLLRIRHPWP